MENGEGQPIVSAVLETRGGGVTSWQLPGFQSMTGAGGRADLLARAVFAMTDGAGAPRIFSTEAPDTLIVSDAPDSVVMSSGSVTRTYRFTPGSYVFDLVQSGDTGGLELASGALATTEAPIPGQQYFNAAWFAEKFRTAKTSSLEEERPLGRVRWAGARSRYFCILLMPLEGDARMDAFASAPSGQVSPLVRTGETSLSIYAGPVDYEELSAVGRGANKLVDFGWPIIRWIGLLIYLFLEKALSFISNWGLRILVLSAAMKLMLWPLSFSSARSMRRMQLVQPKVLEMQKKYANDPVRQRQEMQKLYKENGVNPLGGCLPLLLQMPIFFALYRVLESGIDLRGAGFLLWITDLSRPETLIPFGTSVLGLTGIGLLPVLMGVAMFLQQKMTTTDPSQKMMVYIMPVFMTWLFMKFPAGLTLYWFVNNLLSICEQMLLKRGPWAHRSASPAR